MSIDRLNNTASYYASVLSRKASLTPDQAAAAAVQFAIEDEKLLLNQEKPNKEDLDVIGNIRVNPVDLSQAYNLLRAG